MHWIDWTLMSAALVAVVVVMYLAGGYLRSVADYIAGGRLARRYLLTNAAGEVSYGVVTLVAVYEQIYKAGWIAHWWQTLLTPITLLPGILGFVTYRFRQTKALTLPEFFEMRYSRRFRLFTGFLAFLGGMLVNAIAPAVQARFFVYLLDLPQNLHVFGLFVPTFLPIMILYMVGSLLLITTGGQITLMTVECIEGMISQFLYAVVTVGLLCLFTWGQLSTGVTSMLNKTGEIVTRPPGSSITNPFDAQNISDFNLAFVLIMFAMGVYGTMAGGMGSGGGASCALNAHEARMAGILGHWREFSRRAMISFLALCALAFLYHPDFAAARAPVTQAISHPDVAANPALVKEVRMPMAVGTLLTLLPVGIKGIFAVIMFWVLISGSAGLIQSRGNVFVQDCVLPFLKRPWSKERHILYLRLAGVAMATILCVVSALLKPTDFIIMWGAHAAAIFVAGGGSCIIGGLYWKRGTTQAAWATMITGLVLTVGTILYNQAAVYLQISKIPVNGQIIAFLTCIVCIVTYVTVSLLTCRLPTDMDKLLHRGKYAENKTSGEKADEKNARRPPPAPKPVRSRFSLAALLNFDANFTRGDKIITAGVFLFNMTWAGFVLVVTLWNLWRPACSYLGLAGTPIDFLAPWSQKAWMTYWFIALCIMPFTIGIFTTIWFTWGGVIDLRDFFKRLRAEKIDESDDGTVRKEGDALRPAFPVVVKLGNQKPDPEESAAPKP